MFLYLPELESSSIDLQYNNVYFQLFRYFKNYIVTIFILDFSEAAGSRKCTHLFRKYELFMY